MDELAQTTTSTAATAAASTTAGQRSERFDLKTLYETSRLLSGSLDLDFVSNNLLLSAMSKLLVTRGYVWLHDPANDGFSLRASKGTRNRAEFKTTAADFQVSSILTGDDVPEAFAANHVQLVAPILFGDRRIGLLGLGGKVTRERFSPQEIEFVSSLVNMSSAAIENSIVVSKLRASNRELDSKIQQLNTLFDLSQEFNATIDRDRLIKLLTLTLMGQMMVSRHVVVISREGTEPGEMPEDDVEVVSVRGVPEASIDEAALRGLWKLTDRYYVDASAIEQSADNEPAANQPAGDASIAWLRDNRFALVLPVQHQGLTCGVLCFGPKQTREPYSDADVDFLSALANLFIVSLQNSFLVDEQIEKERLEEEMRLARQIQEKLQPSEMPKVDGLQVGMLALPSRHVAGDYVDIVALDGNRILTAIGDVTGKGLPASLLMSNVQACLHMVLPMEMTLEEATGHMNRVICSNTGFDKFITYFHGIYHEADGKFEYVNAGHNPPMVLRSNDEVELLETGGLLLGVMASMPYDRGSIQLESGDIVAMFTDGATEAMNEMEEEYGEERLIEAIRQNRDLDASSLIKAVVRDIEAFVGGSPTAFDDLTMIVMKRMESASG